MRLRVLVALICVSTLTLRCASIVHGTTQTISITSEPRGAKAELKCLEGAVESGLPTPTSVTLKRSKVSCSIVVSKSGYTPVTFELQRNMSGWYIANILIGGLVGFIVDAADGAMFNQSPKSVHAVLYPLSAGDPFWGVPPSQKGDGVARETPFLETMPPVSTSEEAPTIVTDVRKTAGCQLLQGVDRSAAPALALWDRAKEAGANTILQVNEGNRFRYEFYRCTLQPGPPQVTK